MQIDWIERLHLKAAGAGNFLLTRGPLFSNKVTTLVCLESTEFGFASVDNQLQTRVQKQANCLPFLSNELIFTFVIKIDLSQYRQFVVRCARPLQYNIH